jgi:hypothetical protein
MGGIYEAEQFSKQRLCPRILPSSACKDIGKSSDGVALKMLEWLSSIALVDAV